VNSVSSAEFKTLYADETKLLHDLHLYCKGENGCTPNNSTGNSFVCNKRKELGCKADAILPYIKYVTIKQPRVSIPLLLNVLQGVLGDLFSEDNRHGSGAKAYGYESVSNAREKLRVKYCGKDDHEDIHKLPQLKSYLQRLDPDTIVTVHTTNGLYCGMEIIPGIFVRAVRANHLLPLTFVDAASTKGMGSRESWGKYKFAVIRIKSSYPILWRFIFYTYLSVQEKSPKLKR
jgi:hypothetical protein